MKYFKDSWLNEFELTAANTEALWSCTTATLAVGGSEVIANEPLKAWYKGFATRRSKEDAVAARKMLMQLKFLYSERASSNQQPQASNQPANSTPTAPPPSGSGSARSTEPVADEMWVAILTTNPGRRELTSELRQLVAGAFVPDAYQDESGNLEPWAQGLYLNAARKVLSTTPGMGEVERIRTL